MKVITYNEYGGYYVPKVIIEKYYDLVDSYEIDDISDKALLIERHDNKLVNLFEKYAYKGSPFKINEILDNSYYKILIMMVLKHYFIVHHQYMRWNNEL